MRTSATVCLGAAVVVLGALAVETAHGGQREPSPGSTVVINPSARSAQGAMGAVRASGDANQNIGCVAQTTYTTTGPSAFTLGCSAIDSGGASAVCFFPNNLLQSALYTMSSIAADSHIKFTWDASGNCSSLTVNNDSIYQPKAL